MTSTFELDLDTSTVKMNQRAKYAVQKSFIWTVIFRTHTHTHTGPTTLPGLLKSAVIIITSPGLVHYA